MRGGAEKFGKEGVRSERARLKLGVELCPEHKGVLVARELGYLHKHAVRTGAREYESGLFKRLHVF